MKQNHVPELWRKCWREGFVPQFTLKQLKFLYELIIANDKRLMQGLIVLNKSTGEIQAGCAVTGAIWEGNDNLTRQDIEILFAEACHECDLHFGKKGYCENFIHVFDRWSREEMLKIMKEELEFNIRERQLIKIKTSKEISPITHVRHLCY